MEHVMERFTTEIIQMIYSLSLDKVEGLPMQYSLYNADAGKNS